MSLLLILRPTASGLQPATLLPIFAAFLYACSMVLTSTKCRNESPLVLALALNVAFVIGGVFMSLFARQDGSFILGPWQPIDLPLVGVVATLALILLVGSVGAAVAYQSGPPATVAAFDYSYLVFSLIWGGLFFQEWPDGMAMIGIIVITSAGMLALPGSR